MCLGASLCICNNGFEIYRIAFVKDLKNTTGFYICIGVACIAILMSHISFIIQYELYSIAKDTYQLRDGPHLCKEEGQHDFCKGDNSKTPQKNSPTNKPKKSTDSNKLKLDETKGSTKVNIIAANQKYEISLTVPLINQEE